MRQRAVHHKKPFSISMRQRAVHRKNRRRAVSYVSTGLARLHRDTGNADKKKAPLGLLQGALRKGAATYSPGLPVPSAWRGLTSLFGMGRGGTPAL